MGGKGGDSGSGQQQMEAPTVQTEGGWTYADGTTTKPAAPKTAAPTSDPGLVTEDPNQIGVEQVTQKETQPYAPPGFGNYPGSNTNLSGLGDVLVTGMQAQPGKKGPQPPQYQGQV